MEILMKTKGIRVSDKKNRIVCVELPDIIKEVRNGNLLHWSILYLYASGHLDNEKSISEFEQQIIHSENGYFITWEELNSLSHKFWDLMDITLIASKDITLLKRYQCDQDMYENCDIVIEMLDSGFWEIFSKDEQFINRLTSKFTNVQFLESDFQKR